jgi:hypothetical protein
VTADCCAALREQVRALEVRLGLLNGQIAAEQARTAKAVAMHIEEQAAHQRTRGELHALKAQRKREARPAEVPAFDREGATL